MQHALKMLIEFMVTLANEGKILIFDTLNEAIFVDDTRSSSIRIPDIKRKTIINSNHTRFYEDINLIICAYHILLRLNYTDRKIDLFPYCF